MVLHCLTTFFFVIGSGEKLLYSVDYKLHPAVRIISLPLGSLVILFILVRFRKTMVEFNHIMKDELVCTHASYFFAATVR